MALSFVLLGIGLSLYLTIEHYRVLQTGFTGKTFCNISSYLNCDVVLSSRYAAVGTLPLAGIGLIFYVYLLVVLCYARWAPEARAEILGLPFFLTLAALAFSVFLAYVSLEELRSFCIFCTSLYVVNLFLAWGFKRLSGFQWRHFMEHFRRIRWSQGGLIVAVIFVLGAVLLHTSTRQYAKELSPGELSAYVQAFFRQPVQSFDTAGRPFWGNPNAKVVVVEFSDFECPYCKIAAFNLKPMLVDYRDQVKLVFMNFPLDKSCNTGMPREGHQRACQVAYEAYCASEQGKFWEYHDEAFDRQPKFSPEALEKISKKLKLDQKKFQDCLKSDAPRASVAADIAQGLKADLQGTPAVYVNGRPLAAWPSRTVFHKVIETYLNQ
jgi:protein-disulfide isomerase/uncharacterized membrane protein